MEERSKLQKAVLISMAAMVVLFVIGIVMIINIRQSRDFLHFRIL